MMLKPASLVSIFIPLDVSQSQLSVVLCCPPCCCWGTPVEQRRSGKREGLTLRALGHVRPSPVDQSAAAADKSKIVSSCEDGPSVVATTKWPFFQTVYAFGLTEHTIAVWNPLNSTLLSEKQKHSFFPFHNTEEKFLTQN